MVGTRALPPAGHRVAGRRCRAGRVRHRSRRCCWSRCPGVDAFLRATADDGLPPSASRRRADARARPGAPALPAGHSGTGIHVGTDHEHARARLRSGRRRGCGGGAAAHGALPRTRSFPTRPAAAAARCATTCRRHAELEAAMGRRRPEPLRLRITQLAVTFSRGAIPGRAWRRSSRYFSAARRIQVASARSGTHASPPTPIAPSTSRIRREHRQRRGPPELAAQGRRRRRWARPDFDRYFGHPGSGRRRRLPGRWTGARSRPRASRRTCTAPITSSCQRVLGITTDEYVDDVDEVSPSDMGTMLHRAFERFVNDVAAIAARFRDPAAPWPATALDRPAARSSTRRSREAHALGLTGWRPAWERTYAHRRAVPARLPGHRRRRRPRATRRCARRRPRSGSA